MNDVLPAILAVVLILIFAGSQLWYASRPYMKGKKFSDMPPGMTYKEAIDWLRHNYNGPKPGGKMTRTLAHRVLMKSGYQCISKACRVNA